MRCLKKAGISRIYGLIVSVDVNQGIYNDITLTSVFFIMYIK
jgi:hypothetical protein